MSAYRDSPWRRGRCHALWLHQHGRCFHCGQMMPDPLTQRERHRKRPDSATIDHVLPRTLGGVEAWLNEVAACRRCNATKADRLPSALELWRLVWLKREALLNCTSDDSVVSALSASPRLGSTQAGDWAPSEQTGSGRG